MQMTEAEIVKSYQRAEKKRDQIKILAELNACQKQTIRDILEKHGEEVPKTGNRYTVKKPEVTEAKGSKRKQKTTDCKDCAMEKCCGYGKPDWEHCDAFTPKGSESSKVSAQKEVGTKSEKQKDAVKTPKAVIELAGRRAQELKDLIDGIQESIRDLREEQDLRRKELAELETWIKEQEGTR